jgi:hypothetical protein
LLGALLDLKEYVRCVREDYDGYSSGRQSLCLPLRPKLKVLRAASMEGDYTDDRFQAIDRFSEDPA